MLAKLCYLWFIERNKSLLFTLTFTLHSFRFNINIMGFTSQLYWTCVDDVLELSQNPKYQDVTIICFDGSYHVNPFLLASIFPIFKDRVVQV